MRTYWLNLWIAALCLGTLAALTGCRKTTPSKPEALELRVEVSNPFRFVVYGDPRFHDPGDREPANPQARIALVQGVATANSQFVCFTGDLVYNGNDKGDWKVFDDETSVWRDKNLRVFPSIGNHELHGDQNVALANYFQRFADLKQNRYYSVRAANALFLVLDSSQEEVSGQQGNWVKDKLEHVPSDVDFVFLVLHHPPYTSSTDSALHGGHSARQKEIALAKMLEQRQASAPFRIVVFSGHVHNYEHHEHGGVVYFVSGGGGARPYLIDRHPDDLFQGAGVNYHYLTVDIDRKQMNVTMNRLDLTGTKAAWTQPDTVKVNVGNAAAQQVAGR